MERSYLAGSTMGSDVIIAVSSEYKPMYGKRRERPTGNMFYVCMTCFPTGKHSITQ